MSDSWYYADYNGQNGPITLQELKEKLPRLAEPENVLVWHEGFTDWVKAGAVAESNAQTRATTIAEGPDAYLAGEVVVAPGPVHFNW